MCTSDAGASSANPEAIDIDNPEEIELGEEDDLEGDAPRGLDESPPDKIEAESLSGQQETGGPPEQEESMFAAVEVHSGDQRAAVSAAGKEVDEAVQMHSRQQV